MVKPKFVLVDSVGKCVMSSHIPDDLHIIKDLVTRNPADISETDEVLYEEILRTLQWTGKLYVLDLSTVEIKEHEYYQLVNLLTNESTIAYAYKNPDADNVLGFGFNTADGGNFLFASDVNNQTIIVPMRIIYDHGR